MWERKGRREAGELIHFQGPRPTQNFKDRSCVSATGTGAQERGAGGTVWKEQVRKGRVGTLQRPEAARLNPDRPF